MLLDDRTIALGKRSNHGLKRRTDDGRSGNPRSSRHSRWAALLFERVTNALQTELQAAEWLIRLDADTSAAVLARWRQWLAQDPRNQAVYRRLEKAWRETDCLRRLRPLDGTVSLDVLEAFNADAAIG